MELIRRALVRGYRTIAITDHVGFGNQEQVLLKIFDGEKIGTLFE